MDLWHSQADFGPISHLDICQKSQIWFVRLSLLDSCSAFLFQARRSQPPGASRVPAWHGQVITEMIISAVINQTVAGSSPPWPSLLCRLQMPSSRSYHQCNAMQCNDRHICSQEEYQVSAQTNSDPCRVISPSGNISKLDLQALQCSCIWNISRLLQPYLCNSISF